jgi:effector-binding domain-containing protein
MSSLSVVTALGVALAQQPLPDARALLDRREQSLGPIEARTRARGIAITGAMVLPSGMSACAGRFEELHRVGPGEERVLATFTLEDHRQTQGTDGTASWTTDNAIGSITVKEGPEQMPVRRMWAIQRSAPWTTLYSGARTLGLVERDGRALYELEMTPLGAPSAGKADRWYLDRGTNELVRVAVVFPGLTGESLPMQNVLGDWRAVDGILYPHERVQELHAGPPQQDPGSDGEGAVAEAAPLMRIRFVCESIRHEALDPARLAPSPEVAEALRDPAKRAPTADARECKLQTLEAQNVAMVRLEIDADKVSTTLATILPEVVRTVTEQKAEMMGPPFSRYHRIDTEANRIDVEAGIPVKAPIRPSGRVKPGTLPAGRAAMTWHVGSYHKLQQSYDRLGAWMKSEGLAARGGFWEIYWTDPGLEPDPSTWRTQIFWPVE